MSQLLSSWGKNSHSITSVTRQIIVHEERSARSLRSLRISLLLNIKVASIVKAITHRMGPSAG